MPSSPPKPCRQPGCKALVSNAGYCEYHQKSRQKQSDSLRGSSHERGYNHKWREKRAEYLRAHPLCECPNCKAGVLQIKQATVVDHIIDHKLKDARDSKDKQAIAKAWHLFWSPSNWCAMAKECHDEKTGNTYGFHRYGGRGKSI